MPANGSPSLSMMPHDLVNKIKDVICGGKYSHCGELYMVGQVTYSKATVQLVSGVHFCELYMEEYCSTSTQCDHVSNDRHKHKKLFMYKPSRPGT